MESNRIQGAGGQIIPASSTSNYLGKKGNCILLNEQSLPATRMIGNMEAHQFGVIHEPGKYST